MLTFGKTKVAKDGFYVAKTPVKVWDINVANMVISKLVEVKNYSFHLIGYLDEVTRPLVLILLKMCGLLKRLRIKVDIRIRIIYNIIIK